MDKEEIRSLVRKKRRELDSAWIDEKSALIQQYLISLSEFVEADVVCCYLAMPSEVRTDRIIDRCWQEGKTVCAPVFRRGFNRYDLARMDRNTPILEGPWRVPEPVETAWVSVNKIEFMAVPGMAFDLSGGRVGHGEGHYDRIMGGVNKSFFKVGLAFEFQIFERVPMCEKDIKLDAVITEKRVIRSAS